MRVGARPSSSSSSSSSSEAVTETNLGQQPEGWNTDERPQMNAPFPSMAPGRVSSAPFLLARLLPWPLLMPSRPPSRTAGPSATFSSDTLPERPARKGQLTEGQSHRGPGQKPDTELSHRHRLLPLLPV